MVDAVELAMKIHRTQPGGHILVFLTGQEEIESACRRLSELIRGRDEFSDPDAQACNRPENLLIVPLYGMLSAEDQARTHSLPARCHAPGLCDWLRADQFKKEESNGRRETSCRFCSNSVRHV